MMLWEQGIQTIKIILKANNNIAMKKKKKIAKKRKKQFELIIF